MWFASLRESAAVSEPSATVQSSPRMLLAEGRNQIELRTMDLDATISLDHPARSVWAFAERKDPKKCCEKRCEMTGKKGETGGNDEEWRGFYFLKTFNKLGAISTDCETRPDLITNQLLLASTLIVILIVL